MQHHKRTSFTLFHFGLYWPGSGSKMAHFKLSRIVPGAPIKWGKIVKLAELDQLNSFMFVFISLQLMVVYFW